MKQAKNQTNPRIGEVYAVQFSGIEHEQQGLRPALVIQNNLGNIHSPNVIVIPFTSQIKKKSQPTHVFLPKEQTGLACDSLALCENPASISKSRLGAYLTTLPDSCMEQVAEASILASSVIAYLDPKRLEATWERAGRLNRICQC